MTVKVVYMYGAKEDSLRSISQLDLLPYRNEIVVPASSRLLDELPAHANSQEDTGGMLDARKDGEELANECARKKSPEKLVRHPEEKKDHPRETFNFRSPSASSIHGNRTSCTPYTPSFTSYFHPSFIQSTTLPSHCCFFLLLSFFFSPFPLSYTVIELYRKYRTTYLLYSL